MPNAAAAGSDRYRAHPLPRYVFAVFCTGVATVLALLLRALVEQGILSFYLLSVIASVWVGGLGPGLLATGLSVLSSDYFFIAPTHSLVIHSANDIAELAVFSLVAITISFLQNAQKRAKSALESLNEKLEERVRQRTSWLSLVYDITGAAGETEPVEHTYRFVLRRIAREGPWRFGQVYAPSREAPELLAPLHVHLPEEDAGFQQLRSSASWTRIKPGEGIVGRVWTGGGVEWVPDLREDPVGKESPAAAAGMRAVVVFPVLVERKAVAVFECFSEHPIERDPNQVSLMSALGLELGLIIHRKQLQEEYAEAVWQEQRRTAQELHDDLGQRLTGLGLLSQSLSEQLKETGHAKPAKRLRDGLEEALQQIRGLVRGVFPVEYDAEGLMAALAQLAADTASNTGVACHFDCPGRVRVEDNRVALHLYRIAQEAVTNAVKHGQPGQVRILLEGKPVEIILSVSDNGRGMAPPAERHEGSGLRIMRYRAAALGANLTIEAPSGGGTLVRCEVPRPEPSAPRRD
jgi:signal transduction histidine kinase